MQSNFDKATDAATAPLGRRIHCGNHRGHHLGRVLFGILSCLALLLAAAPRPSSADVLTKMNLGKAGGVTSVADDGGQPFEPLLLTEEQFNQDDVDVDVTLNRDATRGNTFKFDIDGSIDDEEGNIGRLDVNVEEVSRLQAIGVKGEEEDAVGGTTNENGTNLRGASSAINSSPQSTKDVKKNDSAVQNDAAPSPTMLGRLHTTVEEHVKHAVMSALPSTYITKKDSKNDETAKALEVGEGGITHQGANSCRDTSGAARGSVVGNSCEEAGGNGGTASIGANSCTGGWSCKEAGNGNGASATIEDGSCTFPPGTQQIYNDRYECTKAGKDGSVHIGAGSCFNEYGCQWAGWGGSATIGAGSCGAGSCSSNYKACNQVGKDGFVEIGDGSCLCRWSCEFAGRNGRAEIGDNSCTIASSCEKAGERGSVTIGDNSCTGTRYSCQQAGQGHFGDSDNTAAANIGNFACHGDERSCVQVGAHSVQDDSTGSRIIYVGSATIGHSSCHGENACYQAGYGGTVEIGVASCRNYQACRGVASVLYADPETRQQGQNEPSGTATIGNGSCNGRSSCNLAGDSGSVEIGNHSCTGSSSCYAAGSNGETATIGNHACTANDGCRYLDGNMPNGCPSKTARDAGQCNGDAGDYCSVASDCNVSYCVNTDQDCGGRVNNNCAANVQKQCNENCMAGKTGLTRVEKLPDGTMISSDVVEVQNLEVGDRVIGIDEDMTAADECEVVSVSSTGTGTVYGNYTHDHYVLAGGELDTETNLTVHGEQGDASPEREQLYQVLSSCPLVTDEAGKQATFSICGASLYGFGPMPWSVYLKIHMTMFNLVKTSGIRERSAFTDPARAVDYLPSLCAAGLACATDHDAGECADFEQEMLEFITTEMEPSAREKALAAFPNLGEATKMGSVSYLVSKGKSAVIKSIE